jgi:hypothetical protein
MDVRDRTSGAVSLPFRNPKTMLAGVGAWLGAEATEA